MSLEKRLNNRLLETSCGCQVWLGCGDKDGYGFIRHEGKNLKTHRVSYELHKGSANGLCVLHTCDVPACCNPAHLFLGTQLDNALDRDKKGRNGSHKRSPDAAKAKELRLKRLTLRQIAAHLGSSQSAIGRALKRV